jgi:hypothetical protein
VFGSTAALLGDSAIYVMAEAGVLDVIDLLLPLYDLEAGQNSCMTVTCLL